MVTGLQIKVLFSSVKWYILETLFKIYTKHEISDFIFT